ncbi:flagellar brake protein [Candidatus Ferrigenium straubiae]|jgi:c-di-GMP-binding flagellar brake protein YcgR|uniref:flagellar brake protein n=1 Tax=Candidatus Ferrigenium straubiae TaxID=2919506 RepID=UPI003F4A9519
MQGNIPLTPEKLSEEQEKEFRIASELQIRSLLRSLSEKVMPAALYYGGAKDDFILTTVLKVGEKGLWVEQGVDAQKNRRVVESRSVTLVSMLDQVKMQFPVGEIHAAKHQDYPAFYMPLPASLYRLQHREYYRLMLANSEYLRCIIPVGKPPAVKQLEVPVTDISIGGMKLSYTGDDIDFVPGQVYAGCQIELPDVGKIDATIIVKSMVSASPKIGQTVKRMGCEFKNLDNASNVLLQRYVTMVQRSRTAK